jgi:hypothetical protein
LEELDHLILQWLVADMKVAFNSIVCGKVPVISFLHNCRAVKFSVIAYTLIRGGYYLKYALP